MAGDLDELRVEEIMAHIRAEARASVETPASFYPRELARELATLSEASDIYHVELPERRRVVGPVLTVLRRAARRLLAPILARQVTYNRAAATLIQRLKEQADAIAQHNARTFEELRAVQDEMLATLRQEIQTLGERQEQLWTTLLAETVTELRREGAGESERLRAELLDALGQGLERTRERVARVERMLRRVLYRSSAGDGDAPHEMPARDAPDADVEFDYLGFEERFRGSEADIKERQRTYLDYFRGQEHVLDVGCGRGEFLELLREAGIPARGVDIDLDMVLLCREKGLDVTHGDAFALLEGLPDASLGGLFAAQVVEHLPPSRVIQLVRLAHRKLRPGAPLILETVNPRCLSVFAETFYLDLSHVRPIHPGAMLFLLEASSFRDPEVRWSSPFPSSVRIPALPGTDEATQAFNRGIAQVNELLYGYQDYAVIGRKVDPARPAT